MASATCSKQHRLALVPEGAFRYPLDNRKSTRWFGFLLLPEFTLLAFSSALDPLRIANQLAQQPLYGWEIFSQSGGAVPSSSGVEINAAMGLKSLTPDTYLFVCSGNQGTRAASDDTLSAIRRHVRFGGQVGGICTGAATLARAGLLTGKRFTMHWENQPGFNEEFPDLIPSRSRVERDGTLLTCSGGSASTEMMLDIIRDDYGHEFAVTVADMCLDDPPGAPERDQRTSIALAIESRNPKLLHALRQMYENIEEPVSLAELAANAGVSRRQLERLFSQTLGESPGTVYRNIRVDRAHALLTETDMSVAEIAAATGFGSVSRLTHHFRSRLGITPHGKRTKSRTIPCSGDDLRGRLRKT